MGRCADGMEEEGAVLHGFHQKTEGDRDADEGNHHDRILHRGLPPFVLDREPMSGSPSL